MMPMFIALGIIAIIIALLTGVLFIGKGIVMLIQMIKGN